MKLIDLSHTVFDGLVTYKGLPAPVMCDYLSREKSKSFYEAGTSFQIGRIDMVGNTGTYLDSPFHRYEDGRDLSAITLEEVANLPGLFIEAEGKTEIGIDFFKGKEIQGKILELGYE